MKTNIFSQIKKKGFGHTLLGVFMVLSLILQNVAYVQYAYANTDDSSVSLASSSIEESHDASGSHESEKHDEEREAHSNDETVVVSASHEELEDSDEVRRDGDEHEEGEKKEGDDKDGRDSSDRHDDKKGGDHEDSDIGTIKDMFHDMNGAKPAVTIVATKIVCDQESKLPNWGLGGPDITAQTATDYVAAHAGCALTPDWNFQWGYSSVKDLGGNFIGIADGSNGAGSNTGTGLSDWKTFGTTNTSGVASTKIYDLQGSPKIWVREVMKDGYVPFSYDPSHSINDNNVSAEMYCNSDVLNYDNYDYIASPAFGATYYCVAFNAHKVVPPPVVSVSCPFTAAIGTYVVDYGIARKIVSNGSHADANITKDINIPVGTYEVALFSYDVSATRSTESQPKEQWYLRLHNASTLVTTSSAISDLPDNVSSTSLTQNVGDVVINTPVTMVMAKHAAWSDTSSSNDLYPVCAQLKLKTNSVNQAPVITVVGTNPATTTQDAAYVDLSATVFDSEDGVITNKLVASGTVNTHILGTYTITYNATDSQNLAAETKTRTVTVVAKPTCAATNTCPVNTPPVITVLGLNPLTVEVNTVFTDLGATALDLEDGAITPSATGTVNTAVIGSYTITYNATDSQGATATPKIRTVNVVPVGTPINQKPEITLLGDIVMQLVVGTTFTDPSATVLDLEDGVITNKLVATGTVDANTIGSYTITYNATDSKNLAADTKTRTVNVVAAPTTGCTSNCGGGGSTVFDYPGCTNPAATNYNRLANKDDGSCSYPGGGGGGSVPLSITNEKLVVTGTTSVTVTWNTNLPSDSRVVYGMGSVGTLSAKPSYGYPLTTATDTTNVYNHSMVINGIPSAIATYYRPISSNVAETVVGIELSRTPDVATGTPLACEYLKEYMRMGINNNPAEVTKLQLFLKNYDNASNLQVTGFFDITTDVAVRSFQDKYKKDVLEAWNLPSNTGYVYYTTKKKINEIYCQREFPLSADQSAEIASFRALIERVNTIGSTVGSDILPIVGTNKTQGSGSTGSVAGAATTKTTPVTVSVTPGYAALDANAKKATAGDTEKPETRGRIAIADLLATAPSIAEDVTSGTVTGDDENMENGTTTNTGTVAGTSTKKSLLASVANSLNARFNQCSPTTMYFTLIFLVLALIFATLYFRKPKSEVVEAEVL